VAPVSGFQKKPAGAAAEDMALRPANSGAGDALGALLLGLLAICCAAGRCGQSTIEWPSMWHSTQDAGVAEAGITAKFTAKNRASKDGKWSGDVGVREEMVLE
jgi:hypothetical protein